MNVAPEVIAALRAGEVVVIPTDTVYGLAALPGIPGATDRIFALKGRGTDVPLAVLCADADQALDLAEDVDDDVRLVAKRHWPGPLTLVLRRRSDLNYQLGTPEDTVGVRCPDHDLVRALAAQVGPLGTTSANLHGHPTPPTAREVATLFGDGVAIVVDGGPCTGEPSTVLDTTTSPWTILREGSLAAAIRLFEPWRSSYDQHGSKSG